MAALETYLAAVNSLPDPVINAVICLSCSIWTDWPFMGYGDFSMKVCLILAHFSSPPQALTWLFLTDDTRLFEKKINGFLAAQTRGNISFGVMERNKSKEKAAWERQTGKLADTLI